VRRTYGADDPGNAFRATDSAAARQGGIFNEESNQWTFTDGRGHKYWFIDTTAGNVDVLLPSASDVAPDQHFIVKRLTAGANTLTVTALSGNIDGAATLSIPTQYASYTLVAYNGNFYII
jgi:hypothetical protein